MSQDDRGAIRGAGDGGVAGTHLSNETLRVLVAPATSEEFNTIRTAPTPVACFKVENLRFDFESSVVRPELKKEMPLLAKLIADHTEPTNLKRMPPVSIFGHADPVGNDDLNKALSGRRAAAVYGLVTRRAEVWEDLYKSGAGDGTFVSSAPGDVWGTRSIQIMLNALPAEHFGPPNAVGESAIDPLNVNGKLDSTTRERVRRFQAGPRGRAAGLATDGDPGPATRKSLFLAYMDVICVDAAGNPFTIDPQGGFLAQNADANGKGDFQGCGEFNPALLFSKADKEKFAADKDKTARNEANAHNRRVMVLLFQPGAKVDPNSWPCPRAKEGTGGCIKRFWSDGEKRRSNTVEERRFQNTRDTFACRFYQRLLTNSPCETVLEVVLIRLFDEVARSLPFAPCLVTEKGKDPRPDRASGPLASASPGSPTDGNEKGDAFITIRNVKAPSVVNVKWSRPKAGDGPESPLPAVTDEFEFELDVAIEIPEDSPEEASLTRLTNMGYVRGPRRSDDIREFQRDYKPRFTDIQIDGTLNAATQKAIKEVHDTCDPVLKGQR